MKRLSAPKLLIALIAFIAIQSPGRSAPWVSAYYPDYDSLQQPPPNQIDMRAITNLLFFAAAPNADGSLNTTTYNLASNSAAVIAAAHAAGAKCEICIGGGGTGPVFSEAITPPAQANLVSNIVSFCTSEGYDGVDLDFENGMAGANDVPNFESFVTSLRAALTAANPNLLLTAAAEPYAQNSSATPANPSGDDATAYAAVQSSFNQINIMTYDLSGPWSGWSSWFNSPLYNSGLTFSNGRAFPSCQNIIGNYMSAGIPASKLGIGCAFYGYDWQGPTGPDQALNGASMGAVTYEGIINQFYTASAYNWDSTADAPYLSLSSQFISYDDTTLEALKVDYAKSQGLGGLMCWNIDQQYMGNSITGDAQQPLLAAIYHELANTQPPTAPGGLTATAGNTQVTLAWSGSPAATSYNIYRGTSAGGEGTTAIATGVTTTNYTNTGLSNGTTYFYKVAGVNSVGTSAMSNEASASPFQPVPPPAPTGLTATSGNALAGLSWTGSTGATSYNVYRGTSAGGESGTPVATGITTTTYTNTGLTNGTAYYFKVAAVSSAGTSAMSNEAGTTPAGPVDAPYGGTPWPVPGTIDFDNYDTGGQNVGYYDPTPGGAGSNYRTDNAGNIEACSDTFTGGNGYDIGYTVAGEWLNYTVNVAAAGQYTVGMRLASATSGGTLHIQNAGGTNLTGEITAPGTGGWQTWTTVNATLTLPAGKQILTVYLDTMNNGFNMNLMTLASVAPQVPAAPTGLTAAAGNAQVTLTWTADSGATSYSMYRGTSSGGENSTAIAGGLTATSYTNTGLANGTTYYYKVAAVNSVGTSAMSGEASATPTAPALPGVPTGLTATAGNTQVGLTWTAGSGATSYNVYRGTSSGGEGSTAIATGVTSTSYTNTGLTNGTTYYFKVASVNTVGTSAQSSEASTTPEVPLPSVPTGLTASSGNAQIVLTWSAASNATSYNVYRGTSSGGEGSTAIATGVAATSYTNSSLTNGTTYYYKVASVDTAGTSAQSSEASATPSAGGSSSGPVSINCGGSASGSFVADVDFSGGSTSSTTAAIDTSWISAPVPAQAVFQYQRVGATTYTLGGFTPGTAHQVTMYFAETKWTAAGERQFNIVINGTTEETNFDIFGTVGAENKAYQINFGAQANSSGQIVIQLTTGAHDQPAVASIAVLS